MAPESLIRFAQGISREHAVAAPLSWQTGDAQRPFPTELELRKGFLFRRPETGAPMQPPPAPATAAAPFPPSFQPRHLPPHLAQGRGSPGMFPPRIPQPSPYQAGPLPFQQRMPASPLSGPAASPGLARGPPPYPVGSPRGYSPRPAFPTALSPRAAPPRPPPFHGSSSLHS